MKNVVLIAIAFNALMGTAAMACDGQTGSVIFEDKFSDDSGGWDMNSAGVKIVPPAMELTIDKGTSALNTQNLTFNAGVGDYCMQFSFPPAVPNNLLSAGLIFWATDYQNTYMFQVNDDQTANLYKRTAGNWAAIFTGQKIDGFKTGPGMVHTILLQAKAGLLTFSVDGSVVRKIRAQMPASPPRFGVQVQAAAALTDANPTETFKISDFSVTAGQ